MKAPTKTGARDAQCPFVFASHLPTLHNDDNQNNHGNQEPSTFHKQSMTAAFIISTGKQNLFRQTSPRNASGKCSSCPKRNICRVKICSPAPLDNLGTVETHGIAPVTSIVAPIVCRLIPWVTLLGTITYPLPALPALLKMIFRLSPGGIR